MNHRVVSLLLKLSTSAVFTLFLSFNSIVSGQTAGAANAAAAPLAIETQPDRSTIRGRIFYEDTGRAVKRCSVMFMRADLGGGPPDAASAITDGDGNFIAPNVSGGSYYAIINAPGVVSPMAYMDLSKLGAENDAKSAMGEAFTMFEKIVVDGVNDVYVQIPAKRGGAVGGRVIYENGDAAIGVRVELLRKTGKNFTAVIPNMSSIFTMMTGNAGVGTTDDRGVYRFSGLPTGEYIVKVTENVKHAGTSNSRGFMGGLDGLFLGAGSFLNYYFPDAADPKDAQLLSVVMGQELGEINVTIPDRGLFKLAGKVVSQKDKKPLAGAKVSVERKAQTTFSFLDAIGKEMSASVTDEEGNWSFADLPKGEYAVTVTPNNTRQYADVDYDENGDVIKGPKNLPKPQHAKIFKDLALEDKDVTDVVLEAGYGATISGVVTVEDNKEMPNSVILIVTGEKKEQLASGNVWNYKGNGSSNSNYPLQQKVNSDFKIENITAGRVSIRVQINDTKDNKYYVKSIKAGMSDLMTAPLELKEGQVIAGVKVLLAADAGTLRGKVLDDQNRVASGVSVLIVPAEEAKKHSSDLFRSARSDREGQFEVKLPPGEYLLLFTTPDTPNMNSAPFNGWLDEAAKSAEKVSISADGTSSVTLRKPNE